MLIYLLFWRLKLILYDLKQNQLQTDVNYESKLG